MNVLVKKVPKCLNDNLCIQTIRLKRKRGAPAVTSKPMRLRKQSREDLIPADRTRSSVIQIQHRRGRGGGEVTRSQSAVDATPARRNAFMRILSVYRRWKNARLRRHGGRLAAPSTSRPERPRRLVSRERSGAGGEHEEKDFAKKLALRTPGTACTREPESARWPAALLLHPRPHAWRVKRAVKRVSHKLTQHIRARAAADMICLWFGHPHTRSICAVPFIVLWCSSRARRTGAMQVRIQERAT